MSQISPVVLILAAPLCCAGLYMWWAETYTDSPLAQFSRTFGEIIASRRLNSVTAPVIAIAMLLAYPVFLLDESTDFRVVKLISSGLSVFFFILGFVYLLPLPIPHCLDAQWQWHKRHGFIDENGKIITSTPHQTNTQTYPIGQQTMTIKTSMELPETWRALDLNNPNSPLIPHLPHTSTTLNNLKNSLFIAVSAPARSTGFRPNLIITMDPTNQKPIPLEEAIPGWLTIEEIPFPIHSPDATMSSGIYIDDHQSYTAIQWTWTQRIAEHNIRVYATLTSTTTHINHIANDLPDMISSLEITQ